MIEFYGGKEKVIQGTIEEKIRMGHPEEKAKKKAAQLLQKKSFFVHKKHIPEFPAIRPSLCAHCRSGNSGAPFRAIMPGRALLAFR